MVVLFQTDIYKSKDSRVFCGVFASKEVAYEAAEDNNLFVEGSDIDVIQVELNKFTEA